MESQNSSNRFFQSKISLSSNRKESLILIFNFCSSFSLMNSFQIFKIEG
ncbi:hypothetical protein LEP1GSC016_2701 [Leptospira borgpetersenii serovar Hardjo-bovis str. Sponselee]|uniref:Uncharacterized protein n=4 Tax=Leptospira borgpetersenii TaxID=174 RepID=A0A0S2IWK6_LEPBO|nr:hypothetical protein LBBP_03864 [Leptospira borgpetersenii serovar Ballum]EKQ93799.1 hypothetical protein LEP1GSC101_1860 [Leptospira borgpetersenii str. UI 09149]EKR00860.1 hypothetical protein LEP1GSC121_0119 [Leptospira borgpetersenii serovar Castellonis str. 200801910]EMJ82047.1 hypothetical protein LEP1GSC016_2701 [Leptospira borgpetersenii serovar Hardjo-bovis str. Sponselee]EMN57468.1 hypothetical protein LEP1GSC090_2450 [Leptospira borgpetersenii serovar Javanica str. MK146]EMO07684